MMYYWKILSLLQDCHTQAVTNRISIGEQCNVSQDLNNIHVCNDNNKVTSNENKEQECPKTIEVQVGNQQKDIAMESDISDHYQNCKSQPCEGFQA